MFRSFRMLSAFVLVSVVLVACAGGGASPGSSWVYSSLPPSTQGASEAPATAEATPPPETTAPEESAAGEVVELTIGTDTGDALEFDPASVSAPAGSTLHVTFENRSAGLPHNLTFGEPINVATASVVDAGASEELEFPAPEPGEYTFVCTLHPGMEGTLTIE